MAEEVLVLRPGDEQAKLIARAMASQTASDILGVLRGGEYTSSEIADQLSLPITTVTYHIDNLARANLIEVAKTRWSPKGREVKIYGLRDQVVIVAPGTRDIRSLLLKYASVFAVLIFASIMMSVFAPLALQVDGGSTTSEDMQVLRSPLPEKAGAGEEISPERLALQSATFAFFLGGSIIILVFLSYELLVYYREQRPFKEAR
ncbi:MAG: helix-turn-helix domain-containing protein [Methanomicrobiaceae archaeon]|nr:helix-turn-helix domain-containing protein [Methanomicrobiaceae archaeon]